jgi:hypothetical protein
VVETRGVVRKLRVVATVLSLCAVLAACSADPGSVAGAPETSTSAAFPEGSASPASPDTVTVELDWREVPGSWPGFQEDSVGGTHMISPHYAVHPDPEDPSVHVVTRRNDNATVLRHQAPDGYETAFAGVYQEVLVLADAEVSSSPRSQHITFYRLSDGAKLHVIDELIGADYLPGASALQDSLSVGGHYYFTVVPKADTRLSCVARIHLADWSFETVSDCDRRTDAIYYGSPGDLGHTWLTLRGDPDVDDDLWDTCRMGEAMFGAQRLRIGGEDNCLIWYTGVVLDLDSRAPWVAWTEREENTGPEGPAYASDGKQTIYLGESNGLVLYSCGGYVYWSATLRRAEGYEEEYEFDYLRWRPGGPVEVFWTVRPGDWPIVPNSCNDGILTAVFKDLATRQAHVRYLEPPDQWLAVVNELRSAS